MSVRAMHRAMDCETGSTDWTTIGTRILQAAEMASAVHLAERAGESPAPSTDALPAGSRLNERDRGRE